MALTPLHSLGCTDGGLLRGQEGAVRGHFSACVGRALPCRVWRAEGGPWWGGGCRVLTLIHAPPPSTLGI